jgi:hypothetical protein
VVQLSSANEASVASLFPPKSGTVDNCEPSDVEISEETVFNAVRELVPGVSPGVSGLRTDHILSLLHCSRKSVASELTQRLHDLVNKALSGLLPVELAEWFCGGKLVPIVKKDSGTRPLVSGETLRNLISRICLSQSLRAFQQAMSPYQFGVTTVANGMQIAIGRARSWANAVLSNTDYLILKVDIKNAFNSIKRSVCAEAAAAIDPTSASWVSWCLQASSHIYCQGYEFSCQAGVQQGEPFSPTLFSAGLNRVLETIQQRHTSVQQSWYHDEGIFYSTKDNLYQTLLTLTTVLSTLDS